MLRTRVARWAADGCILEVRARGILDWARVQSTARALGTQFTCSGDLCVARHPDGSTFYMRRSDNVVHVLTPYDVDTLHRNMAHARLFAENVA